MTEQELNELPDVYRKMPNPDGEYQDKEGKRWEIQVCKITEEKDYVQVGTQIIIDEDGNEQEVPVYDWVTVINRGWDNFESLEEAAAFYGLTKIIEQL